MKTSLPSSDELENESADVSQVEPTSQAVCPNCDKIANIFHIGTSPDDYIVKIECPHCGFTDTE